MKVKPINCPHCLLRPEIMLHYVGKHIQGYSVACLTQICAKQPKTKMFQTEKEAVEEWNATFR